MIKLYTTQQVAEELGYTDDSYIRKLIKRRKLHAIKIGAQWLVTWNDIHHFKINKRFASVDREIKKEKMIIHLRSKDPKSSPV